MVSTNERALDDNNCRVWPEAYWIAGPICSVKDRGAKADIAKLLELQRLRFSVGAGNNRLKPEEPLMMILT